MSDKFEIGKDSNGDPETVLVNDEAACVVEQNAHTSSGMTYRELVDKLGRSAVRFYDTKVERPITEESKAQR